MRDSLAVFFGDFKGDQVLLNELDGHLGWRVHRALDLDRLRDLNALGEIPVIYLDVPVVSLTTGLKAIQGLVPNARVVVCYPMSSPLLADELVAVGVFHSVPKPLHIGELRQSLGFVWEAWSRCLRNVESMERSAAVAAAAF